VDAALAGDSVTVYAGTYVENVSVDKDHLTIQSVSGAVSTIVHAADASLPGFEVPAEYVLIHGFTVRNNTTACNIAFGGITVGGDHATISDNTVTGNCKGVVLHASHITIAGNTISDNQAYVASDGLYIWPDCADITITDNDISNNADEGIQEELGGQDIVIARNVISNNGGTGVYLGNSGQDILLEQNTISGNGGAGIYQQYGGRNIGIAGNDILDNGEDGIYLGTRASDLPNDYWEAVLYWHDFGIENNTIRGNDWNGIDLGTLLRHSWFISNTISENEQNGIRFGGESVTYYESGHPIGTVASEFNQIEQNNIQDNTECGIFCIASATNWIGTNNLIGNGDNACSPVSANLWRSKKVIAYTYNGNEFEDHLGNYWDDYEQVVGHQPEDLDLNGIADAPYPMDEDTSELDHHPLMAHFASYFPGPPAAASRTSLPIVLRHWP
jgi:parallel beta-helix repeat protein